jgi:hypothetical protein
MAFLCVQAGIATFLFILIFSLLPERFEQCRRQSPDSGELSCMRSSSLPSYREVLSLHGICTIQTSHRRTPPNVSSLDQTLQKIASW